MKEVKRKEPIGSVNSEIVAFGQLIKNWFANESSIFMRGCLIRCKSKS